MNRNPSEWREGMNISAKFGLREIVTTHQKRIGDRIIPDLIGEVVTIQASIMSDAPIYFVRMTDAQILPFAEGDLIGDPDYDQDAGKYPDEAQS
jgi:hypothetical protein